MLSVPCTVSPWGPGLCWRCSSLSLTSQGGGKRSPRWVTGQFVNMLPLKSLLSHLEMSLPRWLWFEHKPWLSRCCKWITEMWKDKGQFVRGSLESRNLITKVKCIEIYYYYFLIQVTNTWGFPGGSVGKKSACNAGNAGRCKFGPQVRKIPWRRKWEPTPIFLPGRILWTEEPGGLRRVSESDRTEVTEHTHAGD